MNLDQDERHAVVVGICGASNGGKTTLAERLHKRHPGATVIHQDDFYKESHLVSVTEDGKHRQWDEVEAIHVEKLVEAVKIATSPKQSQAPSTSSHLVSQLVIVEGTMLLSMRELRPLLSAAYFLTLDYDTMQRRRSERDYIGEVLTPEYFENCVWPAYMRELKVACASHQDGTVRMLDGTNEVSRNLEEIEIRINDLISTCTTK